MARLASMPRAGRPWTAWIALACGMASCASERSLIPPAQGAGSWDPWTPDQEQDVDATPEGDAEDLSGSAIGLYRSYLRRPAFQCFMSPSCSEYARQAFDRYGPVGGFLLTLDRLFVREGRDLSGNYDLVLVDGLPRFHDPVP